MRIHKEGYKIVSISGAVIVLSLVLLFLFSLPGYVQYPLFFLLIVLYAWILFFFRNPSRNIAVPDPHTVYAPADGTIVAIEETTEEEYLQRPCIQVSIFMSPLNIHVNRYPVDGTVQYCQYHPGKYIVAWHPKSSMLNEHATVAIKTAGNKEIVVRQIAGAIARRIVTYSQPGQKVKQGDDLGFIKFGSRVDVFLPTDAKISVALHQKVKGNITGIAII